MDLASFRDPNLTPSQRAVKVLALRRSASPRALRSGHRQDITPSAHTAKDLPKINKTIKSLAQIAGVSTRYVDAALRIEREAPSYLPDIEAGNLSVKSAERAIEKSKLSAIVSALQTRKGIPVTPVDQISAGLVWVPCKARRRLSDVRASS